MLLGAMVAALLAVALTSNPVANRFHEIIAEANNERESGYADDRLAIWDANWRLFIERPLLGHGMALPDGYRDRAYDLLGLKTFSKKLMKAENLIFLKIPPLLEILIG